MTDHSDSAPLTLITLGVSDLTRAAAFYATVGFARVGADEDYVADLDNHLWELAYNPGPLFAPGGGLVMT